MIKGKNIFFRAVLPVALVLGLGMTMVYADRFLREAESPAPLKNKFNNVKGLQNAYRSIYNQYKDSVVFISTEKTIKTRYRNPFSDDPFFRQFFGPQRRKNPKTRKARGLGTGFIISSDGYICTNHHVIANMDLVTVKINDKQYKAKVIGSDKLVDIALLKIKGKGKFKPVSFGNSDQVQIGDIVLALGNPFGLDRTFTSGIVSATSRRSVDQIGNSHIQTDAAINRGNSGGPLINIDGEVIGVNRAIYSRSGGSIGIGFSIPVNIVKSVLKDLKKYGKVKRGYIGVSISPLTREFARELGLKKPEGALVGGVENGSPAERGGIKIRDVIVKINGKKVSDYRDLIANVGKTKVGKTIKVTVWRDGSNKNLWITVKERP